MVGGGSHASSCRGRRLQDYPGLRAGPAASRLRRDAGHARRQGRCPDAGRPPRSPAPLRTSGPAGSPASPRRPRTARPTSARRWCSPATACRREVALGMGINKRDDRPLGVAVRRYYTQPARGPNDDYLESHLELWDRSGSGRTAPKLLPGYGWIFGLGDGTVNVGLGMLSSSKAFGKTDYRALLRTWLDGTPEEWGLREENAHRPDRRRRPADGLQPHPALRGRAAAGRRRRRRGQPVQRRGHRLRDGVGSDRRRVRAAGPRPARGAEPGGRAARLRHRA